MRFKKGETGVTKSNTVSPRVTPYPRLTARTPNDVSTAAIDEAHVAAVGDEDPRFLAKVRVHRCGPKVAGGEIGKNTRHAIYSGLVIV